MGFFLYKTMKGDPGYVPLNPDLTTTKKVYTESMLYIYIYIFDCVYIITLS